MFGMKKYVPSLGEFVPGMVVRHKISHAPAVIVKLFIEQGAEWATVTTGYRDIEEFDTRIAEIEHAPR